MQWKLDTLYRVGAPRSLNSLQCMEFALQLDSLYRVEVPWASTRCNVVSWDSYSSHYIELGLQSDTLYRVGAPRSLNSIQCIELGHQWASTRYIVSSWSPNSITAPRCTNLIHCIELGLLRAPTRYNVSSWGSYVHQLDTLYRVEVPRASIWYNVSTWKVNLIHCI